MVFHPEIVEASADFYERAPLILRGRAEFDVPVARLWREVEEFGWLPGVSAEWETPVPHGPGSRRRLSLGPLLLSNEFVTRVDTEREMAFFIGELPVPGVRAIGERLILEPLGRGRSAVTYTIAIAPAGFPRVRLAPVTALARPIFSLALRTLIGRSLRRAA
ncbi:hypothetical protein JK358_13375 [Nocardia sp. 2]|uniref:Polyketide cyclase n=1 Tax=Nocardia acididurans TaxID=2802282 RepID=A0ABS1M4A5_9NOCA|nr:hypothetical protein [Nocardia acididurans]MBL1075386.1 hypothetical protein [Nocardia acididurans]